MATLIQTLHNVLADKDPYLAVETKRILLRKFCRRMCWIFYTTIPAIAV